MGSSNCVMSKYVLFLLFPAYCSTVKRCSYLDFGSLAARAVGCGHGTKLTVEDLYSVTLGDVIKQGEDSQKVFSGNHCQWIDLNMVRDVGTNCVDGTKFVVKQPKRTRKQFLSIGGKVIIAFVKNGNKFTDCESFEDVTKELTCKAIDGEGVRKRSALVEART